MEKSKLSILLIAILTLQLAIGYFSVQTASSQTPPNVYIGVDIAYGAVAEAQAEIDRVSDFTNLVVLGSTQVTWFQNRVNDTFQYAYDKGLSIISLRPSLMQYNTMELNETEWYNMAQNRWGDRLLGFYIMDEPGGKQIDGTQQFTWNNYTGIPTSYGQAATMFTEAIGRFISSDRPPVQYPYKVFTSDYALYWYDYKAGYDVIWTELGGNSSQQINIALCRAAATTYGKDWGAIITWSYTDYPWIENSTQLYEDMLLAYNNGAKYIVVFDSNEQGGSILQKEHLDAMQRFYTYVQSNPPQSSYPKIERVAYALPNAYGFGFRWPTDHIWGIWQPDELTTNISKSIGKLLNLYGEKLDIIYNDGTIIGNNGYNQLLYWNAYDPDPSPTATPTTPPTTTTPSPTPTLPQQTDSTLIIVTAAAIPAVIGCAAFFIFLRRQKEPKSPI